jgi:hypothetical protein
MPQSADRFGFAFPFAAALRSAGGRAGDSVLPSLLLLLTGP